MLTFTVPEIEKKQTSFLRSCYNEKAYICIISNLLFLFRRDVICGRLYLLQTRSVPRTLCFQLSDL